jgi:translocation and assembly module TamA
MRIGILGLGTLLLAAPWRMPAALAADPQSYRVQIAPTGDGAMDATLRATSDLVTLRRSAPVSPFGLIVRARGEAERLKTVLESYGYYQSSVTIQINGMALGDPALAERLMALPKNDDARVQISCTPGPLYHLRTITIDGALPAMERATLTLKPGAPAVAADVLGAGARLLTALQEDGYAFAKVDAPVAYEDGTDPVLDVTFHVESGAQVNIGQIRFEGLQKLHENLLRRRLLLRSGERYSSSAVERARGDLLNLGVFAAITVQVGTTLDSTGGVPITFQVRERLRHAFGVNAAYSTDLGGSGGVTWSDRNTFGNAEQLTLAATVLNLGGNATNGIGYDSSARLTLPDFGHRDQSLQFALEARKQNLLAYDQTSITGGPSLTRRINARWTVSAGVTSTEEQVIQDQPFLCAATTATCTEGSVVANPVTRDYTLVALPLTVSFDSTDLSSPLDDPTHGMRDSASLTPTESLGSSNATYLISTIKLATYFDLAHLLPTAPGRSVLAARVLIGLAQGAGEYSLPPDQRFYGGGSGSIRGYAYQAVGPQIPLTQNPLGGTAMTAGALEFRQRFAGNFGAAFFVDAGQVSNKPDLLPGNLFFGVGAGARYYTPIGPIRLDVAVPLRHDVIDYNPFQVYIGLAQAF